MNTGMREKEAPHFGARPVPLTQGTEEESMTATVVLDKMSLRYLKDS